jgi:hypothetical protein
MEVFQSGSISVFAFLHNVLSIFMNKFDKRHFTIIAYLALFFKKINRQQISMFPAFLFLFF